MQDYCCDPSHEHNVVTSGGKHAVALIDANPAHQKEVSDALLSFYEVDNYQSADDALTGLKASIPALILVGKKLASGGGVEFIYMVRHEPAFADIPIIYIVEQDDSKSAVSIAKAHAAGANDHLIKPYRRSMLINTISGQLNSQVERNWEILPQVQQEALKGTVSVFNGIADVISSGHPLPFGEVRNACAPLVEAINNHDFKGILNGVRDHDNYTYAHSMRVATLLSLFGHAAGLKGEDQMVLASGGLLHDVGKMLIPHHVLNKPGRLNEDELAIMKSHVPETVKYLQACADIPKAVLTIAEQHHEKLDGSGYPYGLKGAQLNELARMAAIVDIFSALTDRRVYKPPMEAEKALTIMTDEMSAHIDQHFLKMFKAMLLDAVG